MKNCKKLISQIKKNNRNDTAPKPLIKINPREYRKESFSKVLMQDTEEDKQAASLAEEYNQRNPLHRFPAEILNLLFFYSAEQRQDRFKYHCSGRQSISDLSDFENFIVHFAQLKVTCKKFNTLLTIKQISEFCNLIWMDRNREFKEILRRYKGRRYSFNRLPILVPIYAGIDSQIIHESSDFLLERAIRYSDIQLIKILFGHKIHPNAEKIIWNSEGKEGTQPFFFSIKTMAMLQVFIDNKVDLHTIESIYKTNVLWKVIKDSYPSSLMEFYLDNKVTAKQLDKNNSCLLHQLANPSSEVITNIDNFLQKCNLFLNTIPDMINTLDKDNMTPLDWAKESFENAKKNSKEAEALEKLIVLLKEHGALAGKPCSNQKK